MSKNVELVGKTIERFKIKMEIELINTESNELMVEATAIATIGLSSKSKKVSDICLNRSREIRKRMMELKVQSNRLKDKTESILQSEALEDLLKGIINN